MHYVLLALFTIFSLVWAVIGAAWQNLTATILKSLVFVATITPGFQKYLENKITTHPMPISELPALIRKTVGNPIVGYALRQVDGIDILEVDDRGLLRSLVKSNSSFNGRAPSQMSEVTSAMPILILDRANTSVEVDTIGPVLMTRAHSARVHSQSIVLLCDVGSLDAGHVDAPILLADRDLKVENVSVESSLLNFASALDGARLLLLKTMRGEPLVAADQVGIETLRPERRSIVWFLLRRMKCKVGLRGFRCNWELNASEVQVLLDQKIAGRNSLVSKSLGKDPMQVDVFNPRVALESSRAKMTFDVVLTAPNGQGVVSNLLANPVPLTNLTAFIGDVVYDPTTGLLNFSKPRLADVQTALPFDRSVQKILVKAVNAAIESKLEQLPYIDVKSKSAWGYWLLRKLKLENGRLHLGVGLGRCEENLTSQP